MKRLIVKFHYPSANPDSVALLAVCTITGTVSAILGAFPESVQNVSTGWFSYIWAISLALGSILALLGIFWRDEVNGNLLELGGRALVAVSCSAYSFALLNPGPSVSSYIIIGFVIAIATSSMFRCYQLSVLISQWKKIATLQIEEADKDE